jgi:hypothetical protein
LVTVITLIFGLVAFRVVVAVFLGVETTGVVVVVTFTGAGGSAVVGAAPLESARACAALDAVVAVSAPLLADFFLDEGLLVSLVVAVVCVDVVETRAGSKVLVPGAAPGASAAGVEEPPPLDPQPATTSETTTAAITLGVRDARKG